MVLAAGRGKRLRPYTDVMPKPLLDAGGVRLCDWSLAGLKRAGITDIVMNCAHLATCFEELPAEYARRGITLELSREGNSHEEALESLGGILKALPLLTRGQAQSAFLVAAGDLVHGYDFSRLIARAREIDVGLYDVFLVAVLNPDFHGKGDMTVTDEGTVVPGGGPHTYGCLMAVSPRIFEGMEPHCEPLFPWLWQFARTGRLRAEVFTGYWDNIGTPAQLEALRENKEAQQLARF